MIEMIPEEFLLQFYQEFKAKARMFEQMIKDLEIQKEIQNQERSRRIQKAYDLAIQRKNRENSRTKNKSRPE